MADASPSAINDVDPQVKTILNTIVEDMQHKMTNTKSMNVDDAEKLLDNACNDCIETFRTKMEEIRATAKRGKPDPSSPTYTEDQMKYTAYITGVATGIDQSKILFNTVLKRIQNIIATVIDCLKAGLTWIWEQLNDAFTSVRTLWNY